MNIWNEITEVFWTIGPRRLASGYPFLLYFSNLSCDYPTMTHEKKHTEPIFFFKVFVYIVYIPIAREQVYAK